MKYKEVVKTANEVISQYEIKLTIRQIYYRLVSDPYMLFSNTPSSYQGFDKIMTRARERGHVDWHRIEDRSRGTLGGDEGFNSPEEYLNAKIRYFAHHGYARLMWENQPNYVEAWVEKDALAGLFQNIADKYNVLVYPTRGYSSFTKIAEAIGDRLNVAAEKGKTISILHFHDHDPSGLNMGEDLENRLEEYGTLTDVVKPIALNIDQVRKMKLAPNPTKLADPRSNDYVGQFGDSCWELDAIPPKELQQIIKESILEEINADIWNDTIKHEEQEREKVEPELDRLVKAIETARGGSP